MSAIEEKINELYTATKDLQSPDEMEPHCQSFNEWVATEISDNRLKVSSLGTLLSRNGFYKKFNTIPLVQGGNAIAVEKRNEKKEVIGTTLKHYVVHRCSLTKEQWDERNASDKVTARLDDSTEIDPDAYIEVTEKLLKSNDPNELAVGIIAATGRRLVEVIARGSFTPVESEPYKVLFKGQAKKRGKETPYVMSTLFPANVVCKALNRLQNQPDIKNLKKSVANEFPGNETKQNKAFQDRKGNVIRRVVLRYYGGDDNRKPILAFRHESDHNDCKALRAACAALVTARDCDGAAGAKMLFYARFLGHMAEVEGIETNDKALRSMITSLNYADYYVTKSVDFPLDPEPIGTIRIPTNREVGAAILDLKAELGVKTQTEVLEILIASHLNRAEGVRQLRQENEDLIKENQQLKEELANMGTNQELVESIKSLQAKFEALEARLDAQSIQTIESTPTPIKTAPEPKEEVSYEDMSNSQLWTGAEGKSTKGKGSSEEKVRRCFNAIATYNNTIATGDGDRLAITNQALRTLSGVNGLIVGEWIKTHADEVISHHAKYEMLNPRNPNTVETYYNKRLGETKIMNILELVNNELLDGVALKKK
jgi:hypothetical protein